MINHGQKCGKLRAKAMLLLPGLPCLLFRSITRLTLGEINLGKVSFPIYSSVPLENPQCSLAGRENKCCREPLHLSNSAVQRDLCTHSCLFAERKSTGHIVCQPQFIKLVRAVCIDYHCPFHQKGASGQNSHQSTPKSGPPHSLVKRQARHALG